MYLKKVLYKNVGPLDTLSIEMPFNDDGFPKPLIIVGENGSGKSTLLSNIVDSFYEIASIAFTDAQFSESAISYQYYKMISSDHIKVGNKYLYSYIQYDNSIEYLFKCGELSFEVLKSQLNDCSENLNWHNHANYKKVIANKKEVEEIFTKEIFAFFDANRYEKPSWIGDKYHIAHPSVEAKYNGRIPNPITVKDVTQLNLQWLLDLIVDSRADIQETNGKLSIVHTTVNDLLLLSSARTKVEQILSTIINKDVYFGLNFRNNGKSRFNIRLRNNDHVVVPSFDSLSTGEVTLFNIFSSIIRYADKLNINSSFNFHDITGIVLIDEIELHLHTSLQREVLPKLIKLFPKVQFIITTHSPLFLLGMRTEFGDNGFEIYQLPIGTQVTTESFSEFQRAFDYMTETQQYQNEVQKAIEGANDSKPLLITEGATDWRHIKAAFLELSARNENKELFENMEFEFLEFDPPELHSNNQKLEMGNATLCAMCTNFSKIKQKRKIIFIADCDDPTTNKKLSCKGKKFKKWGNNVFSILLPLPEHRKDTPLICIEHYYTDDEIKTSIAVAEVSRRLYIGNEFDKHGVHYSDSVICRKTNYCGANKINIIDDEVFRAQHGAEDNLALSKMLFATNILNKEPPFDQMCFNSFLELFEIIKEIITLPLE